ncbi:permease [Citrobacter amalonaticus]|nr:permease [Citrobacter amalonaticus]
MSGLKQELGLAQGIGLLSTSLLGTGVFAVPALAALVAGNNSLWAWPVLIVLVFPVAIVFALLGRHYPSAGGVAHFVGMAFGPHLERVTGWLFLSVIPVGLPAALHIAAGFGQAMFGWHGWQLLLAELGTLALVWFIGSRGASSSANLQTVIAGLIVALIVAIWWAGDLTPAEIPFPAPADIECRVILRAVGDVLVLRRSGSVRPSGLRIQRPRTGFPSRTDDGSAAGRFGLLGLHRCGSAL